MKHAWVFPHTHLPILFLTTAVCIPTAGLEHSPQSAASRATPAALIKSYNDYHLVSSSLLWAEIN